MNDTNKQGVREQLAESLWLSSKAHHPETEWERHYAKWDQPGKTFEYKRQQFRKVADEVLHLLSEQRARMAGIARNPETPCERVYEGCDVPESIREGIATAIESSPLLEQLRDEGEAMTVKELKTFLAKVPEDHKVLLFWDGSARGGVEGIFETAKEVVIAGEWGNYERGSAEHYHGEIKTIYEAR